MYYSGQTALIGKSVHEWGQRIYGKTLSSSINFTAALKIHLNKNKNIFFAGENVI